MTWSPIPPRKGARHLGHPVVLTSLGESARSARSFSIVIRRALLPGIGDFLTRGGRADVLVGAGEHLGMLRIVPGASYTVIGMAGRESTADVVRLLVPWPDGMAPGAHDAMPVDHDCGDDWSELTIPGAPAPAPARAAAPPVAPVPVPAPARTEDAPARPAPRASIMDRVPDPAAALRGARR